MLPRYAELTFLAAYDANGVRDQDAARRFFTVFDDLEALLATRSEFRYDRWEADALRWGDGPEDARLLADNARRLVTVWGHSGDGYLDDYSARYWAGLMGYYRRRWEQWANLHPVGAGASTRLEDQLLALERSFLRDGTTTPPAQESVTTISRRLLDAYGQPFVQAARQIRATMQDGSARGGPPSGESARCEPAQGESKQAAPAPVWLTAKHDDEGARP